MINLCYPKKEVVTLAVIIMDVELQVNSHISAILDGTRVGTCNIAFSLGMKAVMLFSKL